MISYVLPSHEMGIVHQINLIVTTLDRIRKETPSPNHLSTSNINDRIIIEAITEKMRHLKEMDYFLNVPANIIELEEARVIFDDLTINEVSAMMYDMEHPYVIYKDWLVTPWDICNVLLSKEITEYTGLS